MAPQRRVLLPLDQLTDRQIHLHLISLYDGILTTLTSLEKQMADLNQSVADLEAAVDSINERFARQLLTLKGALDSANQALADEELDDQAKDAALQEALGNAQAAADQISEQVKELNEIGADPETPVEPNPDEPHPDNTLPGDLPQ
jgi:predicted  nucleic acid-binding Zn-ribbon protein